jgi:hypothetical protein
MLNGEDEKIAGYSIEIWNSLFEEEINFVGQSHPQIVASYQWDKVANLLIGGLAKTCFTNESQSLDDESDNSISQMCKEALNHLSQIITDKVFDYQFQHS